MKDIPMMKCGHSAHGQHVQKGDTRIPACIICWPDPNALIVDDAMSGRLGTEIKMTCPGAPLQFEGAIDGNPFYFRARWEHWSFQITKPGTEPILPARDIVLYSASGKVGEGEYSASWMAEDDGRNTINACVEDFRAGGKGNDFYCGDS